MFQSMSTIREKADENSESADCKHNFEGTWPINKVDITKDTDSGDEASYSSTTSLDSLADSRARSQKARNITEKRRRDKLNMYINQLASSLPQCSHQKLDKSSILKEGVDYLRKFNELNAVKNSSTGIPSSSFLSADELGELMLESVNGVIICINEEFNATFVTEQFQHVFGLEPGQLVGQSIEKFIHPDDLCTVREKLKPTKQDGGVKESGQSDNGFSGPSGQESRNSTKGHCIDVSFRLAVGDAKHESSRKVRCLGAWKERTITGEKSERRENLLVLMAMPENQLHLRELSYPKAPVSFSSRHSMDGKFLFVDSSCTLITGYLPYELMNTSLYFFIHEADLEEALRAHRSLTNLVDVGSVLVFFRFRSKSNQWLLMKVILRVTYNPMTSKPEYFNASMTLATHEEIYQYKKMRLSNTKDGSITYESMLSGSGSLLLASLAKERNIVKRKKTKMVLNFATNQQAESAENDSNISPLFRRSSDIRDQQAQGIGTSPPLQSFVRRKGESVDAMKESESHLHEQLNEKVGRLSASIKSQQAQLEKINQIMSVVKPKMVFSDGLKVQQEQEQQIYDCLSTTVLEQQKQCNKLKTVLEGKMKINETKRRAIELRGKAKAQKQMPGERTGNQRVVPNPTPGSSKEMISGMSLPSPQSQSVTSPLLSPTFSFQKSPMHNKVHESSATSTDTMPQDFNSALQSSLEPSNQQSLQRQLQFLQHQQDVLNAQGMALAAQGGMSGAQLQVFQSLMQQQRALLPLHPSSTDSVPRPTLDPGREDDFPMQSMPTSADSSITYGQSPNDLQLQILRLQNLQQELQVQMRMLQNHQSDNGSGQANNFDNFIMQLQQQQHIQGNEQPSPRQQTADSTYMQQRIVPSDASSPPTYRTSNCIGGAPLSSTIYTSGNKTRPLGQQENLIDGAARMFHYSQASNALSSHQTNDERGSLSVSVARRLPQGDSASFQRMRSSRNSARSSSSTLTNAFANSQDQHQYHPMPFSEANVQGSSQVRDKEKKLEEEDSVYQYVNNIPGQTQQLMQLHQAQRMHILRQQQQQLQAVQRNQQQRQQQQLQQQQETQQLEQQQQHLFQQSQPQLPLDDEISAHQAESLAMGSDQGPSGIAQNSADVNIDEMASLNQWQNDLQVGQVSAMSDMDLFELLSGQSVMNLTEQDEQVLDLLIAEGGDMLHM